MEYQTYELLKRYYRGQLTAAEREAFDQRMQTDAAFAEEVAGWAAIYKGLQQEGDRQLDEQLRELGHRLLREDSRQAGDMVAHTSPKRVFGMPRWLYAAAAVLLLLIAWPVYQNLKPGGPALADNRALFDRHFQAPPAPDVRDGEATAWRTAYRNKDYTAAIDGLEKLLADPAFANRSEASLYLGISHLAAGRGKEALDALGQVGADSFDHEEAQWYSALAYIIVDDVIHAKQTLNDISGQTGHPHRAEAQEMLKSMK
jgi:hypothetical protein